MIHGLLVRLELAVGAVRLVGGRLATVGSSASAVQRASPKNTMITWRVM